MKAVFFLSYYLKILYWNFQGKTFHTLLFYFCLREQSIRFFDHKLPPEMTPYAIYIGSRPLGITILFVLFRKSFSTLIQGIYHKPFLFEPKIMHLNI